MKNILIYLLISIFLSSCSLSAEQLFLIPVDTSTPAPTSTKTYTPAPTFTPITPTLTFTLTPTLAGLKSPTPTSAITPTATVTRTLVPTLDLSTVTSTVQMDGFVAVLVSPKEFYRGTKCQPASVKFTVQVADSHEVAYVTLSVRFKSNNTDSKSKWTSIGMETIGAGTYVHELFSDEMSGDTLFRNPWVEYQLVAVTADAHEVGRTQIFRESLSMLECITTPTPTATGVTP